MDEKQGTCSPGDPNRFWDRERLATQGFKCVGKHVQIDQDAIFINPQFIEIGDRTRIDMGVLISAGPKGVRLGCNVHLGTNSLLFGGRGRIEIHSFGGVSSQVRIYTVTDNYLGDSLSGPTVPDEFKDMNEGNVILEKNVMIGSGSLLLPSVRMHEGSVCCAHTVVTHDVPECIVIAGHPARRILKRNLDILRQKRREYLHSIGEEDD